ncbi:MAG: hypothetical protein WBP85_16665 [Terracidiphilus sp.]
MSRSLLKHFLWLAVVGLAAGCANGDRQLQSLSISPATATANGSPVQFTATGHWSESPTTVTPQAATWVACTATDAPTTDATISSAGMATCASGAKGTYEVYAWDPRPGPACTAIPACGGGCEAIIATAQITCP